MAVDGVPEVTLGAGFSAAAFCVALILVLSGFSDLVMLPEQDRWPLFASSLASAAVLACLGAWHRLRGFAHRSVPDAAGVAATTCAVNSMLHVGVTGDPLQATFLMLTLVGSGAVLPTAAWLLVVDAVCLTWYAMLTASHVNEPLWRHFAVMLLFSVAFAHVLQRLRARGQAQLQRLTDALAALAARDQLTGLYNRRGLEEAVAQMLRQREPALSLGAVCVDVNGFKVINDELGHAVGDDVLVQVAEGLRSIVRVGDVVVRVGGDEFVVLAPGADALDVDRLAHRARTKLSGAIGVLALPWSVSVGSATCTNACDATAVRELLRRADLAMYDDKQTHHRKRGPALPEDGIIAATRPVPAEKAMRDVRDVI